MVIVLSGTNDYLRHVELKKLVSEFIKEHGDFGLEKIDASDIELGRLLENVASLPFLAGRRMIVLSNLGANKTILENIEQLLDAVADTTDLIVDERKFDKRLSAYKTLKKRVDFRELNEMDERGLASWLIAEAKTRGGSLSSNDASYLISRAGLNQMGLSNELDKLLSFDPKITRESIDELVEPLPQSSIFDLLDSAFSGNKRRTIELYEDQRKQQVEPQAIMGMIAWQLHIVAVVKSNEKDDADTIAREAKLNPYVVRKTLNITRNLTQKEVKALISRALDLDVRLKSENIDADDALQHFLLTR
jgi:DNA polymerase-3 subunit delta